MFRITLPYPENVSDLTGLGGRAVTFLSFNFKPKRHNFIVQKKRWLNLPKCFQVFVRNTHFVVRPNCSVVLCLWYNVYDIIYDLIALILSYLWILLLSAMSLMPCFTYWVIVLVLLIQSALQRLRSIEESIESERAAHLETKFNSEIVQVKTCRIHIWTFLYLTVSV